MSDAARPPDTISLEAHRDHDHPVERSIRWLFVTVVLGIAIAALFDVFGQSPTTKHVTADAGTLRVEGPGALRGGLLFQGLLEVDADRTLRRPTLVLEEGWLDGITLNTVQPEPTDVQSEDRGLALEFGPLAAGRTLTVYLEFQVNPTTVGRRSQDVALRDGETPIAAIDRDVTIFP